MVEEAIAIILIYSTEKRKKSLLIVNAAPKHFRKIK